MDLRSNEPFWLIKNGLVSSYPSLREDAACDVLVVGGGITGSLIAHQCIDDGFSTILIDKRNIANGSTSATTSMLQYEIDTPLWELIEKIGEKGAIESYQACYQSIDTIKDICRRIKSTAAFRKKKSLYFAALKKDVEPLKREFESRSNAGFPIRWMEQGDIETKYELYQTHGGILSHQGASLDSFMLVHELLAYNEKKGLQVFDKTEACSVNYGRSLNEVLLNTGSTIKARKIIYCVGYESAAMIKEKFVDLISTYAMVSEIDKKRSNSYKDLLIWNTDDPYLYMRTTGDGRFLIGGEDEEFHNAKQRDEILGKKEARLIKAFEKHLPYVTFYPDFVWAGTFGKTKDGLPYIGEHKNFRNSYFVLGFGGNGITFSVTGMEMVSAWLAGKKHYLKEWFKFGR